MPKLEADSYRKSDKRLEKIHQTLQLLTYEILPMQGESSDVRQILEI